MRYPPEDGFLIPEPAYWRNRPVLITGATGFVGANLVRRLQSLQARVHALVRPNSSTWRLDDCREGLTIVVGDLRRYEELERAVASTQPDVIFHLATARGTSDKGRLGYVETSILGSAYLIECLRQLPDSRLLIAGSSTEYAPADGPIPETHPILPSTLHGAVKAAAGILLRQAALTENLAISQLRIFHVYGPWESSHRLLPQAILHARAGKPVPLVAGISRRDWIHVDDVVRALLMAALPQAPVGVFNVGSGVEHTNDEVLDTLASVLACPVTRLAAVLPKRPTDSEHRYADIALARAQLGWSPRFNLAQGIQNTLSWLDAFPDAWLREQGTAPVVH